MSPLLFTRRRRRQTRERNAPRQSHSNLHLDVDSDSPHSRVQVFMTAESSGQDPVATFVSCKIQDKFFFFFFRSCRHEQSDLRLNVFTLRKECNNVIDRFGYTSLFPITALKLFIFLLGCPVFPDRECYLLQLRGFRLLKSEEKSHHSTL